MTILQIVGGALVLGGPAVGALCILIATFLMQLTRDSQTYKRLAPIVAYLAYGGLVFGILSIVVGGWLIGVTCAK